MHGATPLHILCARAPQLKPAAAAGLVAALATPSTVSLPAAPAMTPAAAALKRALPLHEATPLELAAVAAGDDPALLEALLAAGADADGEAGARAVMVTLLHGKLARARVLLQRQVCSAVIVALWRGCQSAVSITLLSTPAPVPTHSVPHKVPPCCGSHTFRKSIDPGAMSAPFYRCPH